MNNLYFIALIPPQQVCAEVTAFKEHIAARYNSKKALRVIPHITLKSPFAISPNRDTEMRQWFKGLTLHLPPFIVHLDGFGTFENPANPVLFVKPELSNALKALQHGVIAAFTEKFDTIPVHHHEHDFHPHITIAYRDILPDTFTKARAEFIDKKYSASFTCASYYLLKHDGSRWQVIEENNV